MAAKEEHAVPLSFPAPRSPRTPSSNCSGKALAAAALCRGGAKGNSAANGGGVVAAAHAVKEGVILLDKVGGRGGGEVLGLLFFARAHSFVNISEGKWSAPEGGGGGLSPACCGGFGILSTGRESRERRSREGLPSATNNLKFAPPLPLPPSHTPRRLTSCYASRGVFPADYVPVLSVDPSTWGKTILGYGTVRYSRVVTGIFGEYTGTRFYSRVPARYPSNIRVPALPPGPQVPTT